MNKIWYQHNNLAVKLRDALEAVINGQGLPIVFADLEKGSCTVEVVYNGETCTFYNKNPTPITQKVVIVQNDIIHPIAAVEDNEVYNEEFSPAMAALTKTKYPRKKASVKTEETTCES
jgi:hypothetical protein